MLRDLSNDEEDTAMDTDPGLLVPYDPQQPWLQDHKAYLDVLEQVPKEWSAIQWWGVSTISVLT